MLQRFPKQPSENQNIEKKSSIVFSIFPYLSLEHLQNFSVTKAVNLGTTTKKTKQI